MIELMLFGPTAVLTDTSHVSKRTCTLGSAFINVMSSRLKRDAIELGLWAAFSSVYSSTIPPSRQSILKALLSPLPDRGPQAPTIVTRMSEPELPPSTERPSTRMVLAPLRAAARAALVPAEPPPTTSTSTSRTFSINPPPHAGALRAFWPADKCTRVASASPTSGHARSVVDSDPRQCRVSARSAWTSVAPLTVAATITTTIALATATFIAPPTGPPPVLPRQ
mmetsp:Transcript_4608/g.11833  ORF Transcript_4608/g.11833 Transcript_4608/m.11833 type:complete len:224 (-) Transcript_4608:16-687(-)